MASTLKSALVQLLVKGKWDVVPEKQVYTDSALWPSACPHTVSPCQDTPPPLCHSPPLSQTPPPTGEGGKIGATLVRRKAVLNATTNLDELTMRQCCHIWCSHSGEFVFGISKRNMMVLNKTTVTSTCCEV